MNFATVRCKKLNNNERWGWAKKKRFAFDV